MEVRVLWATKILRCFELQSFLPSLLQTMMKAISLKSWGINPYALCNFFLFLHHVWGLDLCLFSYCGAPPFIYTWVIFFSGVQPLHLTSELNSFWKPQICWGLPEENVKGSSLKINHGVFQIKFNESLLDFSSLPFLTLSTNYRLFSFFFPPF